MFSSSSTTRILLAISDLRGGVATDRRRILARTSSPGIVQRSHAVAGGPRDGGAGQWRLMRRSVDRTRPPRPRPRASPAVAAVTVSVKSAVLPILIRLGLLKLQCGVPRERVGALPASFGVESKWMRQPTWAGGVLAAGHHRAVALHEEDLDAQLRHRRVVVRDVALSSVAVRASASASGLGVGAGLGLGAGLAGFVGAGVARRPGWESARPPPARGCRGRRAWSARGISSVMVWQATKLPAASARAPTRVSSATPAARKDVRRLHETCACVKDIFRHRHRQVFSTSSAARAEAAGPAQPPADLREALLHTLPRTRRLPAAEAPRRATRSAVKSRLDQLGHEPSLGDQVDHRVVRDAHERRPRW